MFAKELQAEWRRVKWIVAAFALYVALSIAYLEAHGMFTGQLYFIYLHFLWPYYVISLPLLVLCWLIVTAIRRSPVDPGIDLRARLTPQNLARFTVGYGLLWMAIPFIGTFTQIKISLSAHGFVWERRIAGLDAWLHGGHDPAEWLARTLGGGALLTAAEINYDMLWQWYNLIFLSLVTLHPRLRPVRGFYYAFYFGMTVLLGNVLAGLFISAGPAFYGLVTGDAARFAVLQQMLLAGDTHLRAAHAFQHYLWQSREQGTAAFGTGISAFPSVHVFIAACNALFIHRYLHRGLGWLAALYAVLVLVSSAYLGWHYLVDGYAAILLAVLVFRALAPRISNVFS